MTTIITRALNDRKKLNEQIDAARAELNRLVKQRDLLTLQVQRSCSHPPEYINVELTNVDRDPGEARHYEETCEACGKVIESYSIVQGKKWYGDNDIQRED
jgi:hypothetical protein